MKWINALNYGDYKTYRNWDAHSESVESVALPISITFKKFVGYTVEILDGSGRWARFHTLKEAKAYAESFAA